MTEPRDIDDEEIEALLPWYVTGRLTPDERARVAAHLAAHPEAYERLAEARGEALAAAALSEAIAPPDRAALDRLMAGIASTPQAHTGSTRLNLIERLAGWIASLSPQHLGYAAAALIMVLIAQTVTLGTVFLAPDASYTTATGPDVGGGASASAELLIGFAPEATMADVTNVLKENALTVTDGPRAGLYRVRIAGPAPDAAAVAARLQSSPIVTTVLKGR